MKLIGNAQFLLNSVHRIQSYVDKVAPENKHGALLSKDFPKSGRFTFEKVSLRYSPSLPLALDGVSFDLPHGSKVGVVGRTGSGKSTLLVALFRLIQPCDGTMFMDGQPVNSVAVDALRQQLSIIPQDPAMFEGTLRLNLDPFHEYSDQQVRAVIHQVGLSETRDMHSTVLVSGEDWSLGERQLVSRLFSTAMLHCARVSFYSFIFCRFVWAVCCSSAPSSCAWTKPPLRWTLRQKRYFSKFWKRVFQTQPSSALLTVSIR
jgi:ABC-type multidrug transport system fused ATPase/permease subunit